MVDWAAELWSRAEEDLAQEGIEMRWVPIVTSL